MSFTLFMLLCIRTVIFILPHLIIVFESNRILTGSIYLFFKQYGISFSLSFYFAFQLASNYFVLHTYTHTGVLMLLHFDWLHAVM